MRRWSKNLYSRQGLPDNHVDEDFLKTLSSRQATPDYEYWELVEGTSEILHVSNALVFFLSCFRLSYTYPAWQYVVLSFDISAYAIGYALYVYVQKPTGLLGELKTGILLVGTLYTLCPVLSTINANYADDTIYLLTSIFSFLHLLLFDYTFVHSSLSPTTIRTETQNEVEIGSVRSKNPGIISMNCALMAALMLSSRLNSVTGVFMLLWLAFMMFGFLPYLRRVLNHDALYSRSLFGLAAANLLLLSAINGLLASLYLCVLLLVRYVGPISFLAAMGYKSPLEGPWSLPKIKNYSFVPIDD